MKKILGLDLGTNSIGWALVDLENNKIEGGDVILFPVVSHRIEHQAH